MKKNNSHLSKLIVILLIITTSFIACEKEKQEDIQDTPTNPELVMLTPANIQVEDLSITRKKISWTFNYTKIDGFKVDRKKGEEKWETAFLSVPKDQYYAIDSLVVPDSNITYQYRVYAWAGNSVSLFVGAEGKFGIPAPENLEVEKLNDLTNQLTWNDISVGENGYMIDRKIDDQSWLSAYKTLPPDTEIFTDSLYTKGDANKNILYRVYAYYEDFTSASPEVQSTFGLPAPSFMNVSMNSCDEIKITWGDISSAEQGYKIDRKIYGQNWQIAYATVGENIKIYRDHDFPCNTEISYRVYAYADTIESGFNEKSVNTAIDSPDNLTISMSDLESIQLTWNDHSVGEDGFRIDRKIGNGAWVEDYAQVGENIDEYSDTDFPKNKTIYYRISAYYKTYLSGSAEGSVSTTIPAPTSLNLSLPTLQQLQLNWNDNSNGEHGFSIDRKIGNAAWENDYAEVAANVTSFTDTDFPLDGEITYRVAAFYDDDRSAATQKSLYAIIPQPIFLNAVLTSLDKITVYWVDKSTGEDGFIIDRKVGHDAWIEEYAVLGENYNNFEDTDFPLNSTIYYRIHAWYNNFSSEPASGSVNATIPAPTDLTFTMNNPYNIRLNWTDNASGEHGYRIDRKVGNGNWQENYAQTAANAYYYSDNDDFTHEKRVYYRVYAFFDQYNSASLEGNINTGCAIDMVDARDGKTYEITEIGDQCWMAENLNYEGSGRCYDNLPYYCQLYGRLYTWLSVMNGEQGNNTVPSGVQGICPDGWHVPSDEEWKILEGTSDSEYGVGHPIWDNQSYRGSDAGHKLKSTSDLWFNNSGGSDEFGFAALPGGKYRDSFSDESQDGFYWSCTPLDQGYYSAFRQFTFYSDQVYRSYNDHSNHFSVRCIKD